MHTQRARSVLGYASSLSTVVAAACGSGAGDEYALSDSGAVDAAVMLSDVPRASACPDGPTRACTCDAGTGTQNCQAGSWGACYCAPPPIAVNRTGDCAPGTYLGDFSGFAGTPAPFFPVVGLSLAGGPPLMITLVQSGGSEFLQVGDGSLSGSANGLFNFQASITGTLDCSTKKFTGMLDGSATDVFGIFINEVFSGNMTADYDSAKQAFVNGKWDLLSHSPDAADGGAPLPFAPTEPVTGNGDWNANLSRDGGVAGDAGASDGGA